MEEAVSKSIAEMEAERVCGEVCTPAQYDIEHAIDRALAAERRRIAKGIRAAIVAEHATWDALSRERKERDRRGEKDTAEHLRQREDCARVVQGLNTALACVRAPRRGR